MFDITAVRQVYGDEYVINALSGFPEKVILALDVAEKFSPDLAQGILSNLAVREDFSDVIKIAQTSTIDILSKIPR